MQNQVGFSEKTVQRASFFTYLLHRQVFLPQWCQLEDGIFHLYNVSQSLLPPMRPVTGSGKSSGSLPTCTWALDFYVFVALWAMYRFCMHFELSILFSLWALDLVLKSLAVVTMWLIQCLWIVEASDDFQVTFKQGGFSLLNDMVFSRTSNFTWKLGFLPPDEGSLLLLARRLTMKVLSNRHFKEF